MFGLRAFFRTFTILMAPCLAQAEEQAETGWEFELTTAFEYEPAYTGSDKMIAGLGVGAEASYTLDSGTEFFLGLGEAGVEFGVWKDTRVRALLEYEQGRDNSDDPILSGFDKVEDTVEFQLGVEHEIGPFFIGAAGQIDTLGRGKGLVGFVVAGYRTQLTPRLSAEASVDFSFANAEHINTEVGVTNAEAVRTGLASYSASGGYKGMTLGLGAEYDLFGFSAFGQDTTVSLFGQGSVEYYGSAMSKSPLIKDEGRNPAYEASVGVNVRF